MPEIPKKLNVKQQLLVTAAVDEILETTNVHQQALIRMLAIASEHNLNAANLLEDLRDEIRWETVHEIPKVVNELRAGVPIESALTQVPGTVPKSVVMAMATVQSQGLQKPLHQALLNAPTIRRKERGHAQDTTIASKLAGLFLRYVLILGILTFLMRVVIPQFKDMFEDFGVELPLSMQLLIEVSNVATHWWFLLPLIVFAAGLYLLLRKRYLLVRYLIRLVPSLWQQPAQTKQTRKDRSLAWVVQAGDDLKEAAIRFVSSNGIGVRESKRVAAAKKIEAGAGIMESLTSERVVSQKASMVVSKASSNESAGWILRNMSSARELRLFYRGMTGIRLFIWIGDFVLMFLVSWSAIAIFQSLIGIIRGLT